MGVLNGVRFCDKCNVSVPRDEVHLNGLCGKCWTRKRAYWRVFVVGLLALLCGGVWGLTERAERTDLNAVRIEAESLERDTQIVEWVQAQVNEIAQWADNVNNQLVILGDSAMAQKQELATLASQLADLSQNAEKGLVADTYATAQLSAIRDRIVAIEKDIKDLSAIPPERLEQTLRSVVGVGVYATFYNGMGGAKTDHWMTGSGAIFKKETAGTEGIYRYYVLTAYHCYQDYFNYVQNLRPKLSEEQQKKKVAPSIEVIVWVKGAKTIVKAQPVYPKSYNRVFQPIQDWIILSFESKLDLPTIELADDTPVRVGDKVYQTGVSPAKAPSIFSGWVAVTKTQYGNTTGYQGHCFPGQSGGAILNKDLKLVGMTLALSVSQVGGDVVLDYGWNIVELRRWNKMALLPLDIQTLLGAK